MKIQNKLNFRFTGIFALILTVFCIIIWWLSKQFIENEFYNNLENRAYITATVYLEADEISEERLEDYKVRFLKSLSQEAVHIYDTLGTAAFIASNEAPVLNDSQILKVVEDGSIAFKRGKRQFFGLFYKDNQGDFIIVTSAIDVNGINARNNLQLILILGFAIAMVITFLAGRIFAREAMKPIKRIVQEVDVIHVESLYKRLGESDGKDEISELAQTFNNLLDRLENAFAIQKTFIAHASHELRTPITGISGEIEFALMKERPAEDYKAALISVQEEIEKLFQLTESILDLAKASFDMSKIHFQEFRLDDILLSAREVVGNAYPERKIFINFENVKEASSLSLFGNPQLLTVAFRNIIVNAVKFSPETSKVKIMINQLQEGIEIVVEDFGSGIAPADLSKIFIMFFRADNTRIVHGHGIGLAVTQKIISLHNGKIDVQSEIGKGTTVSIYLPFSK